MSWFQLDGKNVSCVIFLHFFFPGGFAIVYLVSDQKNRQFALKRQFVNDDTQQVDSCKRECLILVSDSSL